MAADRQGRQLSDDCRQGKSDSQLLPQILLVGKMTDFFYQNPNDLKVAEGLWSVAKELVEELEHRVEADHRTLEVGALLWPSRALA